MKKILMVLGCCGLLVGSAEAGERWSAESCKHLQEMKADTYANTDHEFLAFGLTPILLAQKLHCGVDTVAEFDAATALNRQARSGRKGSSAPAPRQPMFCDTKPRALGGSTTDCF